MLQEFHVHATRKLKPPVPAALARAEIHDLLAWRPARIDAAIVASAFEIEDAHGLSIWDALIVAAAGASGCKRLLTEDLQHGQEIRGLRVVSPFREAPPS